MQKNVEKFGISDKHGRTPTSVDPYQMDKALTSRQYARTVM